MKRSKLIAAIGLGVLGFCIAWGWALSSDVYQEVRRAVSGNSGITEEYGDVRLALLYSFRLNYGVEDRGRFRLFLFGDKKSGAVMVDAEKRDGEWVITIEK